MMGYQPEPDLRTATPEDFKPGARIYYHGFNGINSFEVRELLGMVDKKIIFRTTCGRRLNSYGAYVANPPQGSGMLAFYATCFSLQRNNMRAQGVVALRHLRTIAASDSHQARTVATWLDALQYGAPFRLDNLRTLDTDLFNECLAVLRLDYLAERNISEW